MTDSNQLASVVDGLLHAETQVSDRGVDLTVATVYEHDGPGRVDFGGGELEPAETTPIETQRRNPDDDYGWWHLDPGGYLLEYNETLSGSGQFGLQTRSAVLERGAFHPTLTVESLGQVPLFVGQGGLRLKENARVTTLLAEPV